MRQHLQLVATFGLFLALALGVHSAAAQNVSYAQLQRGKYLVDAGDCIACHTDEKDKPFAGGRAIPTPFGTIYSRNITPHAETGIGAWSDDDFYRALHEGVRPDGSRLYPAFPYPYFTNMTHDDVLAMRAYLNTLRPIKYTPPPNRLLWPLNYRVFMRGWDWLFFEPATFASNPRKSAEWNRGAYLVEGAGHCGACHTPKNIFGADNRDQHLRGSQIQNWFAPKLSGDQPHGLRSWGIDDIVEYLKTGRNKFSGATGLMAEVVEYSTSKLTDGDLHAIAVYLKDTSGTVEEVTAVADQRQLEAGKAIFTDSCAACHAVSGEGIPRMFPPLKGNLVVQQRDPTTVVRVILDGARTATTAAQPTPSSMPAFNWKLADDEVAAVASYIRNSWGNRASPVTADTVATLRTKLAKKP